MNNYYTLSFPQKEDIPHYFPKYMIENIKVQGE